MKDYYRILEVHPEASPEIITKAYRTLVQQYHPDRFHVSNPAYAEEKIKALNEAYAVLRDPAQRSRYDRERLRSVSPSISPGLTGYSAGMRQRVILGLTLALLIFSALKIWPLLLMSFIGKVILVVGMIYTAYRFLNHRFSRGPR